MIKQKKCINAPSSLETTKSYDGEDVKRQLIEDQKEKCYLCERILTTDFQIEHLHSQANNESLKQDWNNLFLACGYCNGKKLNNYDDIVNPLDVEVENVIRQEIDFANKRAIFTYSDDDKSVEKTLQLLNVIYNGKGKLRKIKEERFIEYIISIMNGFSKLVLDYIDNPCEDNLTAVREELSISKEALGFKYWIIRSNPMLFERFAEDIVWNK